MGRLRGFRRHGSVLATLSMLLNLLFLAACGTTGDVYSSKAGDTTQRPGGSRRVALITLVLPTNMSLSDVGCTPLPTEPRSFDPFAAEGDIPDPNIAGCLARAYKLFYTSGTALEQQAHRNRVQGALRAASVMQCNDFMNGLNNLQSDFNFVTGTIATALAGAGAVVANESTARLLSGSAAVVTGSKAEFNADIFFQKAVPTLKKAIDQKRGQDALAMDAKAARSIADYPVELAVADALDYNADCSLVAGLAALDDAVALAKNPGLDELTRSLIRANAARAILKNNVIDPNVINPDGSPNAALLTLSSASPGRSPQRTSDLALSEADEDVNDAISKIRPVLTTVVPDQAQFTAARDAARTALDNYAKAYTTAVGACRARSLSVDMAVREADAAIPADKADATFPSKTNEYNAASATANSMIGTIDQSKRAVLRRLANDVDSLTEATRTYGSNKSGASETAVTTALQRIATDFPATLPMADQLCQ